MHLLIGKPAKLLLFCFPKTPFVEMTSLKYENCDIKQKGKVPFPNKAGSRE